MKLRFGLSHFIRNLSHDRSERRRLVSAAVLLLRQRRRGLYLLGPLLRIVPSLNIVKLQLWKALSRSFFDSSSRGYGVDAFLALAPAIRSTQAYRDSSWALRHDLNGFLQRGHDYSKLRQFLSERSPERLLIFHHFDRRGLLPQSWCDALIFLQNSGWQVVLSSSQLAPSVISSLKCVGVFIVIRANIGLCLGAYRDIALLAHFTPALHRRLKALVLCNDSNLLVQTPEALALQLEKWTSDLDQLDSCTRKEYSRPVLSGLTDSAQRDCYHLQSFLLHANRSLLHHPAWLRFWLHYAIDGSKDELINQGEIGLSQSLLAAGVELNPSYPLVHGLLTDPAMAAELQRYGIAQPKHVNQSLFAWRSLLARGYPFVKKHVLFQLAEHQGQPMAIAELSGLIPNERRPLLTRDIEQLLISRYSGSPPRMG